MLSDLELGYCEDHGRADGRLCACSAAEAAALDMLCDCGARLLADWDWCAQCRLENETEPRTPEPVALFVAAVLALFGYALTLEALHAAADLWVYHG